MHRLSAEQHRFAARCTRVADALGQVAVYQLNERGQTTGETDRSGAVTILEWDRYRRLLRRTDPLGRTVAMEHDVVGNVTAATRPGGSRMTAVCNEPCRPLLMDGADGGAGSTHTTIERAVCDLVPHLRSPERVGPLYPRGSEGRVVERLI
ncbi:RHS repeat domain-containing protein [Streptomyces lydicus]